MNVIDNFITQYEREYDFYKQLAQHAHDIVETEIINRGIKAIVSHRAKRVDRLREKLEKRSKSNGYKSKRAIEKDIVDFAGLRVSLYFPSERAILDQVICELFEIVEKKEFPESSHKPKHNKRFSGYWATHYRVKINKNDAIDSRFRKTTFEIQVASVLMHAWSEVEHDLVYKPLSGKLSADELAILDEINGLVLTGEIALERLQKAITERTKKQTEITDKYELTNLLFNNIKTHKIPDNIALGNTQYLANYLKAAKKIQTSDMSKFINDVNFDSNESITDQILSNFVTDDNYKNNLLKYLSQYTKDEKRASDFELFIKAWVLFEKVIVRINSESGTENKRNFVPSLESLQKATNINDEDIQNIHMLRNMRNKLLHGYDAPSNKILNKSYTTLMELTARAIETIKNKPAKKQFKNELKNIQQ